MVDTPVLGTGTARCGGSSPLPGTIASEISLVVELVLPKHRARVRFSHLALLGFFHPSCDLVEALSVPLPIVYFPAEVGDDAYPRVLLHKVI